MLANSFPIVISKLKQLSDDQLVVRLISGASLPQAAIGPITAALMWQDKGMMRGMKKQIENDARSLEGDTARFPIRFLVGTRKCCVSLKFSAAIEIGGASYVLESNETPNVIVITNDCQWEGSEGVLLKTDSFSEGVSFTRHAFDRALADCCLRTKLLGRDSQIFCNVIS